MTGKILEIISQIVLWYENSFRIDWMLFPLFVVGTAFMKMYRVVPQTKRGN